jgi:NAD(P)-dependent dehydrogenase (short-subunit alcohol dehydrogenase family)
MKHTANHVLQNPAWMAVYNASKAAQHSLNETLRIELEPFGVRVINVVTGAIDTIIMTKDAAAGNKFQLPSKSLYQVIFNKIKGRADGVEKVPRTSPADYARVSQLVFILRCLRYVRTTANDAIASCRASRKKVNGCSVDRKYV